MYFDLKYGENWSTFWKMFTKNIISPTCNNGQIYMLMYYGGNKKNFFKISKILPTSKPFLKIEIHIEITYRWNREFFTKNDQISLDSPIVEKSKFYFPPPSYGCSIWLFFFKTRGLSMGKNQNNRYRPLRVKM